MGDQQVRIGTIFPDKQTTNYNIIQQQITNYNKTNNELP